MKQMQRTIRRGMFRKAVWSFWLLTLGMVAPQALFGQGPYCIGENCTANDVQDPVYFLGDVNGNPLVSVSCTPGEPVTSVYLWLTFQVTATNRYDINVVGDINLDGFYDSSFSVCLGDYSSGTYTELIQQVVWDCGAEMIISNTLFSWENNDDGNVPNSCNVCPPVPSKCHRFGNLVVNAPIVADFSYTSQCLPGNQYEVFTFTDETTGGALPYSNYSWDFGSGATATPSTTSGPNATGPFTVSYSSPGTRTVSLTVTDAGGISSIVSYDITVDENPTVTVTADDATICAGGQATLTATVSGGSGLSYQWQWLAGGTWTNVGTNQSTYTTDALPQGTHQYRVIVSHSGACDVTSAVFTVTAAADPTVNVTAFQGTICDGGMASLMATVTGGAGPSNYQWQQLISGTWTNIGNNQSTYTSGALTVGTYSYRVIVTQDAGCSTTSAGATVTVTTDPTVSVTANDNEICTGGSAILTANVSGGAGTTSYQWQYLSGGTWTNVGINQGNYTTPALAVGTHEYRVLITQNSGCSATSGNFAVTVVPDPTVSVAAVATNVCAGGSAELTATVTGGTGTTHYQWQQLVNGTWTNVGMDQASFTSAALVVGTYQFRVQVTQDAGCAVTSAQTSITVVTDPTVSVSGDQANICSGGSVLLTATVTGGAGTANYQWQQLIAGTWTNVGANQPTHDTGPLGTGTHQFRVTVTQNSGCSATSASFVVTVSSDPTVTVTAEANTICDGGMAMLTAQVTGGSGTTTYQWQQLIGGNWNQVGGNQPAYTSAALASGTYTYRVVVMQNAGCETASANAVITVVTDPTVSVTANDNTICDGGTATLTANVSGGAGTTIFQWQQFLAGSWTNVGSNQNTYMTPVLSTGSYSYRVLITQNSGCSAASASMVVSVADDPVVTVTADATTICTGGSALLTANVTGGAGTSHYTWQRLISGTWTTVGTDQSTFATPVLPVGAYEYRVIVTQDAGCSTTSASLVITVVNDPTVTINTSSASICLGGSATLNANVSGGAGTSNFQWQQLTGGTWTNVGTNQSTYTATPATTGTFQYRVTVTQNSGCQVTSASASITVVDDPTVSVTAEANMICDGGMAMLTATVSGGTGTSSFQWQQLVSGAWTNVGSNQSTYTSGALTPGTYTYRVLLGQNSGCEAASANAVITVVTDPTVSVTANDNSICDGGTATLTASVSGGAGTTTYQWQQLLNGTWTNTGANQNTYATPVLSTGTYTYRVLITQNSGCSATSANMVVTVVDDPTVTISADAETICTGGSALLTASVSGGTGMNHYTWQRLIAGMWTTVGTDQPTFATPVLPVGTYEYRVLVSQDAGCSTTSASLAITVVTDPTVSVTAPEFTICIGGTAYLMANVTGGAGATNYQWQQLVGGSWTNVGSNQSTYDAMPGATGTYQYRVLIAQNSGCSASSASTEVVVLDDPTVSLEAAENTVCDGGNGVITALVSGGAGMAHFQWQASVNGGAWTNAGLDQATYTTPPLAVGSTYAYRVFVTQNSGCSVQSADLSIAVTGDPDVSVSVGEDTICNGGSATFMAVVAGGAGTPMYQWQLLTGGSWADLPGATAASYSTPPLTQNGTYSYRVLVTQNSGCFSASDPTFVTVVDGPGVSVLTDANTICNGGSANLTATVTGGAGQTSYQWQYLNGGNWVNVGTNAPVFNTGPLTVGTFQYRVQIAQGSGCSLTSASETITVVTDPTVSIVADDQEICNGGTVILTANVTGGAGTTNYQWQQLNGGTWVPVGTNQNTYETGPLATGSYSYRVLIEQNSGCSASSANMQVTVVGDPTVTVVPQASSICDGGQAVLNAVVTGGTGTNQYQWQELVGGTWTNMGVNSPTYTSPMLSIGTYTYRVIVTQDAGCETASAGTTITVVTDPSVSVNTSDDEICVGGMVTLTAAVNGGAGPAMYQWQRLVSGTWTNVGTNQSSYTTPALAQGTHPYRVLISQNSGCSAASSASIITVVPDPGVTVVASQSTICDGGMASLTATVSGGAGVSHYQWQQLTGGTWQNVGTNQNTYQSAALGIGTYSYRVIVTQDAGCESASATINVNVVADPTLQIVSEADHTCELQTLTMTVQVTGGAGPAMYQWQEDISGAWVNVGPNLPQYTTPPLPAGTHSYRVLVTQNSGCESASAPFEVVVTENPTASLGPDTSMCPGETVQLTVTPAGGTGPYAYVWSTGATTQSITVSPGSTTTYQVTVYDSFGCSNTSAEEILVTVYPAPVADLGPNQTICLTDTVTLVASITSGTGPFSYLWNTGETTQSISDIPTSTTMYAVTVTDSNGCSDADGVQVTVNPCIGLIAGYVLDLQGNPVANVALQLYADSDGDGDPDGGVLMSTVSDGETGAYFFEDVEPGDYVVVEVQPANYDDVDDYDRTVNATDPDGDDSAQGADNNIPVTLAPFEGDLDNNFVENANAGAITGQVRTDFNEPVSGVSIVLYGDANGDGNADGAPIDTAVTDGNGMYAFPEVEPGPYVVVQVQPANHTSVNDYDYSTGANDPDGDDSVQGPDNDIPVTVAPGEVDTNNDFVEDAAAGLICGNVRDNAGNPVANVTLRLYSDPNGDGDPTDGALQATVTNDGETGDYCFEDIEQGSYVVVEIQPANYDDVSDYDHTTGPTDPDGDDSADGPDNEVPVILVPGEADLDNDFIEDANVGSIAGQVREDLGPAIAGVILHLYYDANGDGVANDGPFIATTTTDADGFYTFPDAEPGAYVVEEVQPAGYTSVSDIDGSVGAFDPDGNDGPVANELIPVIVAPGEMDADNDFVENATLGLICGNVSDDTGQPVANVTLQLYTDPNGDGDPADGIISATTTTDGETGDYCFEDIYHGTYVIVEIQPVNYGDVSDFDISTGGFDPDGDDSADGPDNEIPVVLVAGEADLDNNFVEDPFTGHIIGQVRESTGNAIAGVTLQLWNDLNADGIADPGTPVASQVSGPDGSFAFLDMEPGHYVIVELQPAGYISESDFDGSVNTIDPDGDDSASGPDDDVPVLLAPGETDADNDFVEVALPGLICGFVHDDNGNPLGNVTLQLWTDPNGDGNPADGVMVTSVTNDGETGMYCFEDVEHGAYAVVEIQPNNYDSVSDYDESTGASDPDGNDSALGPNDRIPVILLPAEADVDNNFVEDANVGYITGEVRETDGTPVEGVLVGLYNDFNEDGLPDGNTPIATQLTVADGSFAFNMVEPASYVLVQSQPSGYQSESDIDGSINAADPDGNDGAVPNERIPVIVAPGETDADNDFVEIALPGLVCGTVTDIMGNPLANITLELWTDPNGDGNPADGVQVMTATTDGETGLYCFEDAAYGTYVVVEQHPVNYESISDYDESTGPTDPDGDDSGLGPNDRIPVVLAPAEADVDNDFVEDPNPGNITGEVREDNGAPIAGVTIKLHADANGDNLPDSPAPVATAVTNAQGSYAFLAMEPGGYVLLQTHPAGYESVSDVDGTPDPDGNDGVTPNEKIPVVLAPGEDDADNDFVEFAYPGLICGAVTDDMGNPLTNVVLELWTDPNGDGNPADGVMVTSVTNDGETGMYCFEDVVHGTYVVKELHPAGYDSVSDFDESTGPNDPDGNDSGLGPNDRIPVMLAPAEADLDNNFVEDPQVGNITGHVRDIANVPLGGVQVRLYVDANQDGIPEGGVIATATTSASGYYAFEGMETGSYLLDELQPTGYASDSDYDVTTGPTDPDGNDSGSGPNERIPVVLAPAETDADNDFVEIALPGLVCGTVTDDSGNPLANITLELIRDVNGNGSPDDPVIMTVTTDGETGMYCFEDVEHGPYFVHEIQPANYTSLSDFDASTGAFDPDGDDSSLGPNDIIPVMLAPAEADLDNDFVEDPNPGSITGQVREDTGTPIQGIQIKLYADPEQDGTPNGSPLAVHVTDASGAFAFPGLELGGYILVETHPSNYSSISDVDGTPDPDGDDGPAPNEKIQVVLAPGEVDADNDFVEDPFPGAICGYILDAFGSPIANITIQLFGDADMNGVPDGPVLATATSDGETGQYCIEDIEHGHYLVVQVQPANYTSVSDYDETTGSYDPDGDDSAEGPDNNIPVVLEPGEGDFDNNFIEDPNPGSISGQVRETGGLPLAGWTIRLHLDTNADGGPDGPPIATQVTDGTGHYAFTMVEYGNYVVVQDQPWNYFSESDYDGSTGPVDPDGDDSGQGPDENIPVFVAPGETDADNDFVEIPFPSLICGNVSDELGFPLANVMVDLYADTNSDGLPDGPVMATTTTDGETGDYCFEDIPYGTYVIVETLLNQYQYLSDYDVSTGPDDPDGDDSAQGADGDIPVTTTPGEADLDNNFVNVSCPGLPAVEGDDEYFVCDGNSVSIEAYQQMIPGVTYTWSFGDLSMPSMAVGIGPHDVLYGWSPSNQEDGAQVILTLTKDNCPTQSGEVARVYVSSYEEAGILADTFELCALLEREFQPSSPEIPGALYLWDFGPGAVPQTATGYGPHMVYYTTTGEKAVSLWIDPQYFPGISCPDSVSVTFDVIECPGNIAGLVITNENLPLQGVPIQLWPDDDADGQPDPGIALETTFSSSQGQFAFTDILPGNYILKQVPFPGYISIQDGDVTPDGDVVPNLDILDDLIPVTVDPAADDVGNTFMKSNDLGSISGMIFEDLNEDGLFGAGEGIGEIMVRLYMDEDLDGLPDPGDPIDSTVTNEHGIYVFPIMGAGSYVIVEEQPASYVSIDDYDATPNGDMAPNVDSLDNIIPVTIDLTETDGANMYIEGLNCEMLVNTTADSGLGSLRDAIACAAAGDTIFFAPSLAGDTILITTTALVLPADITLWNTVSPPVVIRSEVDGAFVIQAGADVMIHNLVIISGPGGNPAAIDNLGGLILDDVLVRPHPLLDINMTHLVRNAGTLTIRGATQLIKE